MFVIFGLGNPEKKYENTYHNTGFNAVDFFAKKNDFEFTKEKYNGKVATGVFKGEKVMLVKPQTYMNLSGECVRQLVNALKLPLENILVVYDDIDLPVGTLRLRKSGSAGTHNGMRNIVEQLSSTQFSRLRLGIGKSENVPLVNYVLSKYSEENKKILIEDVFPKACMIMEKFIEYKGDLERINIGEL